MAQLAEAISKISEVLEQLTTSRQSSQASAGDCRGLQLAAFDEVNESFESYLQRVENYLEIRNLKEDTPDNDKKRVQIFLNCLGPKLYHTLTCLTAPDEPKTKKYKDLVEVLQNHVCPKPSEVAEQHKFTLRTQHEGESISNFQADLKKIASKCNFVCESCKKSTISTHLRSQFIRGIRDNEIRERLLQQESSVTFDVICKKALAIEASKVESREIRSHTQQPLHSIGKFSDKSGVKYERSKKLFRGNGSRSEAVKRIEGRCFKCGKTNHKANACKEKNLKCKNCGKSGHVQLVCLKQRVVEQKSIELADENAFSEDCFFINSFGINNSEHGKILKKICLDGIECTMELDTGAAVSTISLDTFNKYWPKKKMESTSIKLKTYTGEIINPAGLCKMKVTYNDKEATGDLYVLPHNVEPIIGRGWIRSLNIQINSVEVMEDADISEIECKRLINGLLEEYIDIFTEDIGKIPNYKCSIELHDDNTKPIYMKPRPVPYALRDKIEVEIERLEKANIISKITNCQWGTPIVPVVKKNGDLRLCADYKSTINRVIKDDKYPIPRIEDLFAEVGGGKYYCVLDLHQAYLHMPVDDVTATIQALSTHKGCFKVNRLMFGVKISPNAWQKFMDMIFGNIANVTCFFDDILIRGQTLKELVQNLRTVFKILREKDLHVNRAKCQFLLKSVSYLGHILDQDGIKPIPDKIQAIVDCKKPNDVSELRTFLGLINYYQKFIPDLSSKLFPLNELLQKDKPFIWSKTCHNTFKQLKDEITSPNVLMKYNRDLPLILATDASPTGLGAVISHVLPNGQERPIAFASRSLTKSEKNYSQLDKEATAIFWGLHKFFQYCYGRKITLITDHQPLTRILHPNKDLPAMSALRLLHYANFMSGFDYEIKYRNTKLHANADFLSRFPCEKPQTDENLDSSSTFLMNYISVLPVTRNEIKKETLKDSECVRYYTSLQSGNPLPNEGNIAEFSLQNGCIFKNIRIMIPARLQKRILDELHTAHTGMVRMKALARSYVWWRNIDKDIENLCKSCINCAKIKPNVKKLQVHPWEYPKAPWERLHLDYAGPFMNKSFLIVVDAYTKWVEVIPQSSTTTSSTIDALREIFSRFGLPLKIVTDNGPQFRAFEFKNFLTMNGILQHFSAPYHPATNGQAERFVYTVKQGLRAMENDPGSLHQKLCTFLMQQRKLPNSTTGISPSELMFNRQIRTKIDLVKRESALRTENNNYTKIKQFNIGDLVQVRTYTNKACKWKFGVIWTKRGSLHYEIMIDGEKFIRHIDQIRPTNCKPSNDKPIYDDEIEPIETKRHDLPEKRQDIELTKTNLPDLPSAQEKQLSEVQQTKQNLPNEKVNLPMPDESRSQPTDSESSVPSCVPEVMLRRSTRSKKPPNRLEYTSFS